MAEGYRVSMVEPTDIRKDSLTYPILVTTSLKTVHNICDKLVREYNWKAWRSLQASIGFLDSMVAPYYNKDYLKKIEEIEQKYLTEDNAVNTKYAFVKGLQLWTREMVARWADVKILPARKVSWMLGKGEFGEELMKELEA